MHPIDIGLNLLARRKFSAYEQLILDEQKDYELKPDEFKTLGTALEACGCVLESVDTATASWLHQFPTAYAALMARATFLRAKGRAARGEDTANAVSAAAWREMQAAYAEAYRLYARAVDCVNVPTLPLNNIGDLIWVGGEGVAHGHQFPGGRNWYEYGIARDPRSVMLRFTQLTHLRPEWGGSIEAMQRYLNDPIHANLTMANRVNLQRHFHSVSGFYLVAFEGEVERGFRELDAAIACDVNSPWPYYWRGLSRVHNDEPDLGLADYAKALALDGSEVAILSAEARLLAATHPEDPRIAEKFRRLCDLGQRAMFNPYAWHLRSVHDDLIGALASWQRGADEGDGECSYFVGNAYEKALGVATDYEHASKIFEQAYQQGNLFAASRIWSLAIRDQAYRVTKENAGRLLAEAAVNHEHADSHYWLAMAILHRGLRYEKTDDSPISSVHLQPTASTLDAATGPVYLHHLSTAAEGGIAGAQVALAREFRTGTYLARDLTTARQWLEAAMNAEDAVNEQAEIADAQHQLADMMLAHETEGSATQAFQLLTTAANAGNGGAMLGLARCYRDGVGIEKDIARAKHWANAAEGAGEKLPRELAEEIDADNHTETVPRSIILHLIFGPIAFLWTLLVAFLGKRSIFKLMLWGAAVVGLIFIGLVVFAKLNPKPATLQNATGATEAAEGKPEKSKPAWIKRVEDRAKANAATAARAANKEPEAQPVAK